VDGLGTSSNKHVFSQFRALRPPVDNFSRHADTPVRRVEALSIVLLQVARGIGVTAGRPGLEGPGVQAARERIPPWPT
jgi:hypothetical protein